MLREKPWGHEVIASETEGYTLKIITVKRGCRTSLQRHARKHETYYFITTGPDARVELGAQNFVPEPRTFVTVPPGVEHRITGFARYVEASTPEDPDDITRLDDDYGRVT